MLSDERGENDVMYR